MKINYIETYIIYALNRPASLRASFLGPRVQLQRHGWRFHTSVGCLWWWWWSYAHHQKGTHTDNNNNNPITSNTKHRVLPARHLFGRQDCLRWCEWRAIVPSSRARKRVIERVESVRAHTHLINLLFIASADDDGELRTHHRVRMMGEGRYEGDRYKKSVILRLTRVFIKASICLVPSKKKMSRKANTARLCRQTNVVGVARFSECTYVVYRV